MKQSTEMPSESEPRRGVPAWQGEPPLGENWDPELLLNGDSRNVVDRYRYWKRDAVKEDVMQRSLGLEIAIENLGHDFNIGSIVRTANAFGVSKVHIVGRRRWNRRGAMVTDKYMEVVHHHEVVELVDQTQGRELIGIDILPGSQPIESAALPSSAVLVFGEEGGGLSEEMLKACNRVLHITQYGSTRSINVGHAAAVAMWAWLQQNAQDRQTRS